MLTRGAAISVQQVSNVAVVNLQCHGGCGIHVHSSDRSYFDHSRQWLVSLRNALDSFSSLFALPVSSFVTNRQSRQLDLSVTFAP